MAKIVSILPHSKPQPSKAEEKEWSVANAAYYLAEKRGFAPGQELEDWFQAEQGILARHPGSAKDA